MAPQATLATTCAARSSSPGPARASRSPRRPAPRAVRYADGRGRAWPRQRRGRLRRASPAGAAARTSSRPSIDERDASRSATASATARTAATTAPSATPPPARSTSTLLGGRVIASGVRRSAELTRDGLERRGGVYGLRVDGTFYGDIAGAARHPARRRRGRSLNTGNTGLRVVTDDRDRPARRRREGRRRRRRRPPRRRRRPRADRRRPSRTTTADPEHDRRRRAADARRRRRRSVHAAPDRAAATPSPSSASPLRGHLRRRAAPRRSSPTRATTSSRKFGPPVVAVARRAALPSRHAADLRQPPVAGAPTDGDAFFYAHLSAFSPAARNGAEVKAGTVLGFVGNTGDAEPTPPHLHFEIHPGGDEQGPASTPTRSSRPGRTRRRPARRLAAAARRRRHRAPGGAGHGPGLHRGMS